MLPPLLSLEACLDQVMFGVLVSPVCASCAFEPVDVVSFQVIGKGGGR